jgi:hypothetical protein
LPERVTREIPDTIKESLEALDRDGLVELYIGHYDEAERIFRKQLALLEQTQAAMHRPISKGGPLHNLGIALLGRQNQREALHVILLAYVEDTLNVEPDSEDDADTAPAARILRDSFAIKQRILRDIKAESRRLKSEGKWNETTNPQTVLDRVLGVHDVQDLIHFAGRPDLRLGATPLGFPQPRDRRVFIGTNYDSHAHVIPEIKRAVLLKGYAPIIVAEVSFPPQQTRDVSLLLLHTCGLAVFDVTSPAGQLMEIERARDYGTTVLLVRSDPVGHPPHVSEMIRSLGYTIHTYRDMDELKRHVMNFLP